MNLFHAMSNSTLLALLTAFLISGFIYTFGLPGVVFACVIWMGFSIWIICRSQ